MVRGRDVDDSPAGRFAPRCLWVLGVIACSLVLASPALAASPALVDVGQSGGHASATWTLPAGEQSELIEVGSSTAVGSDGFFLDENVVDFGLVDAAATSWLSGTALAPGTYYVHVKGEDADQDPFSTDWSSILTLVVPDPSAPTTTSTPPPATTQPEPPASSPAPTTSNPPGRAPVSGGRSAGRVARLWFSRKANGDARTQFAVAPQRIFVNFTWRSLPAPNAGVRVVWMRPSGKVDRDATWKHARRGTTQSTSIGSVDFRRHPGRWKVKIVVRTAVVATRLFSVN
jgi:hypothetical protein